MHFLLMLMLMNIWYERARFFKIIFYQTKWKKWKKITCMSRVIININSKRGDWAKKGAWLPIFWMNYFFLRWTLICWNPVKIRRHTKYYYNILNKGFVFHSDSIRSATMLWIFYFIHIWCLISHSFFSHYVLWVLASIH